MQGSQSSELSFPIPHVTLALSHSHLLQCRAHAQVWYDFALWHSAEGGSGPAATAAVLARARQASWFSQSAWQRFHEITSPWDQSGALASEQFDCRSPPKPRSAASPAQGIQEVQRSDLCCQCRAA